MKSTMKTAFGHLNRALAVDASDVEGEEQDKANAAVGHAEDTENPPEYSTDTLFAGRREIVIHHAGAAYRMKITKQGKLILNK